jgi:acyl transferase domain-containing protein/acyl-CoA synthetase (AMP-forming)/AMP-acid ligase II/acyl carrier protein
MTESFHERTGREYWDKVPWKSLTSVVRWRAQETPEKLVFAFLMNGEAEGPRLTFAELDVRARSIAAWLQERKLAGERVLLPYPPGLDFICGFMGCLYAGAVAVPMYPPHPHRVDERLLLIARDARPRAALCVESGLPRLVEFFDGVGGEMLATDTLPDMSGAWQEYEARREDPALLQYTSGSTSSPRGVIVGHGNILHNVWYMSQLSRCDVPPVVISWHPFFHDMGLVGSFLLPLYEGAPAYSMAPTAFLQKPIRWLRAISRYRGTSCPSVNFGLDLCVSGTTLQEREGLDLSCIRMLWNGSEPVRAATLRRFTEAFAPYGFSHQRHLPCYGLAEATLCVSASPPERPPVIEAFKAAALERHHVEPCTSGEPGGTELAGCGLVGGGVDVAIVNPQTLRRCAPDEIGEIWVAGPSITPGYWERPEETQKTYAGFLEGTGEGPYLRTGDLGFLRGGELFVTGRIKDLIIIRGRNVYPQDVEHAVGECHSALQPDACAAFSVDAEEGEALAVIAEIKRSERHRVNADEILQAIRSAVSERFDLALHSIGLVGPNKVPKTSSGKVMRSACRQRYLAGEFALVARWNAPAPEAGPLPVPEWNTLLGSCSPAERSRHIVTYLRQELARALGLKSLPDPRQGFETMGVDSMMAVELSRRLERWLGQGIDLPATLLFDQPNIEAVAGHIAQSQSHPSPAPVAAETTSAGANEPVAIVGLACRFPSAPNAEAFWQLLDGGRDAICDVPADRWDAAAYFDPDPTARGKMYTRAGGFIEDVAGFDAAFFDISPREARSLDPQQRLVLETAWTALESAGIAPAKLEGDAVGVFVGVSTDDYRQALLEPGAQPDESMLGTGTATCGVAGRLSFVLGLRGPCMVIDTACSSSVVAVHQAMQSLRLGESRLALAGGVNLILNPAVTVSFCRAGMLSPDGRCKTFDAAADGYGRGEGCGVVVLKRLSDAQRDGNRILAVLRGSAINQDGRTSGLTAPSGPSQSAVIERALQAAGVAPAEVQYLEAHGTGTPLGDPIEIQAADAVYARGRDRAQPLLVGSVKTNLGHLEAAAGVAGLIKVVLSLQHHRIPPSLHFHTPNPHIRWDQHAVRVASEAMPWPDVPVGTKRRAAVSSFGFVGTNAHLIVEEAPESAPCAAAVDTVRTPHLLALSARTEPALRTLAGSYREWLDAHPDPAPGDLCHACNTGRNQFAQRATFVCSGAVQLREQLACVADGKPAAGAVTGTAPAGRRRVAFLFTGQGSQYAGMGRELYASEPVFRDCIDRCAGAYDELGRGADEPSLPDILFAADGGARLRDTLYAQPAIYALQVALATVWRTWGIEPAALLGHSLGEYAAAAVSGVFTIEDGLKLVRRRAQLMQQLPPGGAMASVTAPAEIVEAALAGTPDVCISAYNGLNTVISGPAETLDALLDAFDRQGVYGARLPANSAFHSMFVEPVLQPFEAYAGELQYRPAGPGLISSLTGARVAEGTVLNAAHWREHVRRPVRFAQGVQALFEDAGCDVVLEIGPKAELMWLAQMCFRPEHDVLWVSSLEEGRAAREQMVLTAGRLHVAGASLDFAAMERPWNPCAGVPDLPTYPFQRQRYWPELSAHRAGAGVDDYLEVRWEPCGFAPLVAAPAGQHWLLLADARPVGSELAELLEAAGQQVRVLRADELESTAAEHIQAALDAVLGAQSYDHVIMLWSPALAPDADVAALGQAQQLGVECALAIAQTLIHRGGEARLSFVTHGAQPVLEGDPVDPTHAPLWGFCRTFGLEHPDRFGGLIDLPANAASSPAEGLCRVLLNPDAPRQMALRNGQNWVPRLQRVRDPFESFPPTLRLAPAATYLITGGMGALGVEVARSLAERGATRIVLSSRRGNAAAFGELQASLQALGCRIDFIPADITRAGEAERLIADLSQREPDAPLRGIIHAAGLLQGEPVLTQHLELLRAVMAPKVAGAWNLHRATLSRNLPLDFFVLFSSAASLLGLRGHSNYSAANAFLDGLAHHRRRLNLPAVSINWGPWAKRGMAMQIGTKEWEAMGTRLMASEAAMNALVRLAAGAHAEIFVQQLTLSRWGELAATGLLPPVLLEFMEALLPRVAPEAGQQAASVGAAAVGALVARLHSLRVDEREAALQVELRRQVGEVLGMQPDALGLDTGFFDSGMNSIMAVELSNRLQALLGGALKFRPAAVFNHPTVIRLTRYLLSALFAEEAASPEGGRSVAGSAASAAGDDRAAGGARGIAIVGIGCRVPGAEGPEEFWRLLDEGVDAISEVPPDRWDLSELYDPDPDEPGKVSTRWGGFVRDIDRFDADFFGISSREARSLDPQHRMLLEVAWQALENANLSPERLRETRGGVFVGISAADYMERVSRQGREKMDAYAGTGNAFSAAAGRISFKLGWSGPALAIDTACSSALVAVHEACAALRHGECDHALAGGVNLMLSADVVVALSRAHMLSPDGRCKAFDASANGFVRSEGCSLLVLKRLEDAERDGDRILAVIRGSAVNQDGSSSGLTVPNGTAQEAVITDALRMAGVAPAEVQYLECHGTGTSLGDPIEVQAADAVYSQGRRPDAPLLIGSVKTNLGHLESAAGATGVIKVVLALQHQKIPRSLHFRNPNPHIPWDDLKLKVVDQPQPWPADTVGRIAGVSSFGFAGTNAHVLLTDYTPPTAARDREDLPERGRRFLSLSARSAAGLRALGAAYAAWLAEHAGVGLGDLCHTANTCRSHLEHRAGLVFGTEEELGVQLGALAAGGAAEGLSTGDVGRGGNRRKVAFLFTGQGSQYAGMGRELYGAEAVFREGMDRCAAVFDARRGDSRPLPLLEVMGLRETADAAAARALLDQTGYTQPALYALEVSLAGLWRSWGVEPEVVLGHSVGEYAAAAVAGVFGIDTGMELIAERARLMQSLPAGGAMVAVSAPAAAVEAELGGQEQVCIAAYNGANTVISGPRAAVAGVVERMTAVGLKCKALNTSHAFHSVLMEPILPGFEAFAAGYACQPAALRLISNVSGGELEAGQVADAAYWARHIRQPVRFEQGMQAVQRLGCDVLVELGPHPVLVGMGQRCWEGSEPAAGGGREAVWVGTLRRERSDVQELLAAVAKLYVAGAGVDPAAPDAPWRAQRRKLSLPLYPFQRQRYWVDLPESAKAPKGPRLEDCVYQVAWEPQDAEAGAEGDASWLIVGEGGGLGEGLGARLQGQGQRCVRVGAADREGLERALDGASYTHVVHLGSLEVERAESLEGLKAAQACGVESALGLLQALLKRAWQGKLWLVTRGTQRVLEADRVEPAQSPVWGLGKTIALEHPGLWGGLLDLPATGPSNGRQESEPSTMCASLAGALCAPGREDHVAVREGRRWVARLVRKPLTHGTQRLPVDPDRTYLVTGGLGGIGLHVAQRLVERGARHLVLAGRRPPSESARAIVKTLEAKGCSVQTVQADVAQEADVLQLIEGIESQGFPPLGGIVHAAGVIGMRALADLDPSALKEALAAKVYGVWLLDRITTEKSLDLSLFAATSSTAAVWGTMNQGAYAAANMFLDAMAEQRNARGKAVCVIDYGPWGGTGMMADASEAGLAWIRRHGIGLLSPDFALDGLEALAAAGIPRATFARVDWAVLGHALEEGYWTSPLLSRLMEPRSATEAPPALSELDRVPIAERKAFLTQLVRQEMAQVVGLRSETIREDIGFFDQGMDSIMAVEFRNGLARRLGRKLPPTLVMDHPTIQAVTAWVLDAVTPGQKKDEPRPPARPSVGSGDVTEPIAVVGLSCRFPGAPDAESFWRLLDGGVDAMREVPPDRWDVDAYYDPDPEVAGKMYTRYAGFIDDVGDFDAEFFGMPPGEVRSLDPQQRLLLEESWHALENAGIAPKQLLGTRTGVYVGITTNDYTTHLIASGKSPSPYLMTGTSLHAAAGRLAYFLGLRGPALAIDTACSSSLVAVHAACTSLRVGETDLALVGGVNLIISPVTMIAICAARALSPDGRCKTFDASADGYARGEGCGVVVLKRLGDARRDGNRILGIVRGSAVNQDGRSSALTVPNGPAQEAVITDALRMAGVAPAEVQYLECHGTGTSLGDPIEVQAAAAALARDRDRAQPLLIGSVKTNFGHLEAAAGVAGLIKVLLAFEYGRIPKHLHFHNPNPHLAWNELAVRVTAEATPWPAPRHIAGVSSFGISGTNAHIVLESAEQPAEPTEGQERNRRHLLTLSARTEPALRALAGGYGAWLAREGRVNLSDLCHTANLGRDHFRHRAGLVFGTEEELGVQLGALAAGGAAEGLSTGDVGRGGNRRKVAFLFTGQGSQYAGMGRELYGAEAVFREGMDRCAAVFDARRGDSRPLPLLEVMGLRETADAAAARALLDQTGYTQPALYALEVSLAGLWRSWGVEPEVVLGHSVGEYAAAAVAGVFGIDTGMELIAERARLMQSLPAGGAMVAVSAPAAAVEAELGGQEQVCIAAYNGANTVISGPRAAVAGVVERMTAVGLKCKALNTSHAFHSVLMEPILPGFEAFAAGYACQPAALRLISNVSGGELEAGQVADAAYWARHIRQPVRFEQGMQAVQRLGCDVLVELGPHPVLVGMGQRCWEGSEPAAGGGREAVWVGTLRRERSDVQELLAAVAKLYVAGAGVDPAAPDAPWRAQRRKLSLPLYPFQRQRYWVDLPESAKAPKGPRLEDCVYQVAWEPQDAEAGAEGDASWLIVGEGGGLGEGLGARLQGQGQRCVRVGAADREGLERALDGASYTHVVHLGSLEVERAESLEGLKAAQACGVESALGLLQALLKRAWQGKLWLVTRGTQRVLEADRVEPAQSPVWGLGRAIGMEHPELWGGLLDLPATNLSNGSVAGSVAGQVEFVAGLCTARGAEDQVALREGRRWVARLVRRTVELVPRALAVRADATYLVTGGLGGIGLQVARRLVTRGARHLVLAGRRAPAEPARTAIAELEARGCTIRAVQADVSRADGVAQILDAIEQTHLPPLDGVVHAAGVSSVVPLADVGPGLLDEVLAAKLRGAWLLHQVTGERGIKLSFFVMTSSTAATWGSVSQGAYAAANAFLDGLAMYRVSHGLAATAIGYGPWSHVGMMAEASGEGVAWLRRQGLDTLRPEFALDGMEALVSEGIPHAVFANVDWETAGRALVESHRSSSLFTRLMASRMEGQGLHGELATGAAPAGFSGPEGMAVLAEGIRKDLAGAVGIPLADIRDDVSFFDQGMDSLIAVEFRNRLATWLQRPIPAPRIYEHPTVVQLSAYLAGVSAGEEPADRRSEAPTASAEAGDRDGRAALHTQGQYTVRWYQPSDRAAILSLVREVWGDVAAANLDRMWDWKYERNPFNEAGLPSVMVVEHAGQIVAMQGGMASRMKIGQEVYPVLWGADTQVHPQHRIAAGLLIGAMETATTRILLGAPNERMQEILDKSGRGEPLVRYTNYTGVLRLAPLLRAKGVGKLTSLLGGICFRPIAFALGLCRPARGSGRISIAEIDSFGEEFTAFWSRVAPGYEALTVRDQAYLTWRFTQCPGRRYAILAARRGRELAGYMVLRDETGRGVRKGIIVDLLAGRNDREARGALVSEAVRIFKARGVDKVECVIAANRDDLGSDFRRNGLYLRLPLAGVIVNQVGPMREKVRAVRDWLITFADSDPDVS